MDRNIYDNDFEAFLKQKSDQYKMYPSERVWSNIYSSLHGRKKWWALGFSLFIIGAGLLVGREVLLSDYSSISRSLNKDAETITHNRLITAAPSPVLSSASTSFNRAGNKVVQNTIPAASNKIASSTKDLLPAHLPTTTASNQDAHNATSSTVMVVNTEAQQVIENDPKATALIADNNSVANQLTNLPPATTLPVAKESKPLPELPAKKASVVASVADIALAKDAAIKYSRWSLQFYASPTISYRRLTTLNTKGDSYIPVAANTSGNINNYVKHKPAPGFEIGSNVQYQLSGSLSVFAGAQLNYSRYYIDAFKYRTEKASIALSNSLLHDTLSGYTDIRNFSGYAPEQLQNKYLQLSLPVGIEIKILGNKKLQFNIAGGLQPTFLLTSSSYLISTDYKNYIQSPNLVRGFNVHTNFEAFISYKTGGLKWQVGPQFRSQLMSSYTNEYRVREYLTEYGIKFGVSRSF